MTILDQVEVRQLEHFVTVAEELSFTRAARRLSYVQSALSVSIRALERDLGVRLFDRTTHGVALTDAGGALLPSARQTLASVEQTRDLAAALKGVLRGTLRIGIMQSFGYLDVPALLGRFHREHPHVEIEMRPSPGGSQALVKELKRGGTDIAFVSLMDDPPGVSATQLAVEDLHLVGTPELLPRRRGRIELSGLSEVSSLTFPRDGGCAPRSIRLSQPPGSPGVSRSKSPTWARFCSSSEPDSASRCSHARSWATMTRSRCGDSPLR
jgi:DNA-binding transcriptional LysR family regulator